MSKLVRRARAFIGRTTSLLIISSSICFFSSHAWSFGGDKRIEKKWYSEQFRLFIHELNMSLSNELLEKTERSNELEALAELVSEKLSAKAKEEFLEKFKSYVELLKADSNDADLYASFADLRDSTYKLFKVRTMPSQLPDKRLALETYQQYCSSCHGSNGAGDGILVKKTKDPKSLAPRDFRTLNALGVRDAYSFFNSIYQGHKSRSMASYKDILTSQQIWSLSFYLLSDQLREPIGLRMPERLPEQIDLEMLATYSDRDLREFFASKSIVLDESSLGWLRAELIFSAKLPRKH